MNAAILACSTLTNHVEAAQEKMGTDYPIIEIDNSKHDRPKNYWELTFAAIENLPDDIDTVLLAMGVCGGAAVGWSFTRRVVLPRVDDCITLLMHKNDDFSYNLKSTGHFYLTENENVMSIGHMKDNLYAKYGQKRGDKVMKMWFDAYESVDIIDTGVYDSYDEAYVGRAQREADLINVPVCHVEGSNIILEKLVSGNWDDQFIVYEKGEAMYESDFE